MIKHCNRCDDYGEIANPDAKCSCGAERIVCPSCDGYSNIAFALRRLTNKIDALSK